MTEPYKAETERRVSKSGYILNGSLLAIVGIIIALWGPPVPAEYNTNEVIGYVQFLRIFFIYLSVMLLLGGLSVGFSTSLRYEYLRGSGLFLLLYGFMALASVTYSTDPVYTLYKTSALLSIFYLVFYFLSRESNAWYGLLKIYLLFQCAVLINNLGFYVLGDSRVTNVVGRLVGGGLFGADYGLAALSVSVFGVSLFFFSDSWKGKLISLIILAFSVPGVVLSQTRSVIIPLLLFIIIAGFVFILRKKNPLLFLLSGFPVIIMMVMWWPKLFDVLSRGGDGISDLSGRVGLWNTYIGYWQDSMLLGYGYAAGSRMIASDAGVKTLAHSDYIQVLVGNGLFGLMIFFIMIGYLTVEIVKLSCRAFEFPKQEQVWIGFLAGMIFVYILNSPMNNLFTQDTPHTLTAMAILVFTLNRALSEMNWKMAYVALSPSRVTTSVQ